MRTLPDTRPLYRPILVGALVVGCGGNGGGNDPATQAPPTTAQPLQAQVLVVGDSARFEGLTNSAYADSDLDYSWTVRRLQSDRPYQTNPFYETTRSAGRLLSFPVTRAASWDVVLTIVDPRGATATASTRLVGRHRFVDNGNGTATNPLSGLTWQLQDDGNRYTLAEARGRGVLSPGDNNNLDVCGNLVLAGHDDWRVPTLPEVGTLMDYTLDTYPIAEVLRPATRADEYHLSDSWIPNSKVDWIATATGQVVHLDASARTYLRCVRP